MIDNLVKKYRTIPQLLGKMEEVVAGSNSGKSTHMASYYHHWERCVFNALNAMILNGMSQLHNMMQARSIQVSEGTVDIQEQEPENLPLFKVLAALPLLHVHEHYKQASFSCEQRSARTTHTLVPYCRSG